MKCALSGEEGIGLLWNEKLSDVVSLRTVFTCSNILNEANSALKRDCAYLVENR
jgi:hypothetical protein